MEHLRKICLSCKKFRPTTIENGLCRLDKSKYPNYPLTGHYNTCDHWNTAGQQYYIRSGWLKKQIEQEEGK